MMREVRLYGDLAKKFGAVHKFDIDSPAEAVRALEANYKGFAQHLIDSGKDGISYSLSCGKRKGHIVLGESDIALPASGTIYLAPVVAGAKKGGLVQTILGVVLIAASTVFPPAAASASAVAFNIGVSLALGGVIQMLTSTTKASNEKDNTDDASFLFNGAVNTQAQGNPVPIGYGEMIVGSAVISAGVLAEERMTSAELLDAKVMPHVYGGNLYLDFTGEVIDGTKVVAWFAGNGTKLTSTRTTELDGVYWGNKVIVFSNPTITIAGTARTVQIAQRRHGPDSVAQGACLTVPMAIATSDGDIDTAKFIINTNANNSAIIIDKKKGVLAEGAGAAYFETALAFVPEDTTSEPSRYGRTGSWKSLAGKELSFSTRHLAWMTPAVEAYLDSADGAAISLPVTSGETQYSTSYYNFTPTNGLTTTGEIRIKTKAT